MNPDSALRTPSPAYTMDAQAMPTDLPEPAEIIAFPKRQAWAILRVMTHQERLVVEALTEKGVQAYAPMHVDKPLHARRAGAKRTRALIRGYVFASLPDDVAIDTARNMHGVIEIMCRDGRPRPVPPLAIGCLIFLEAFRAFDETWEPPPIKDGPRYTYRWRKGERVTIKSGAFAGFLAEVRRGHGRDHMQVLLSIFGRETEIVVGHKDLGKPDETQNG